MAKLYKCVDGDRIDLIVLDHYGDLTMLAKVLASNIHLSKLPLILKSGTTLSLPKKNVTGQEKKSSKDVGELW